MPSQQPGAILIGVPNNGYEGGLWRQTHPQLEGLGKLDSLSLSFLILKLEEIILTKEECYEDDL